MIWRACLNYRARIHYHIQRAGKGAILNVFLPLIESAADREEAATERLNSAGGAETILFGEDVELLREMTFTVLKDFRYRVIAALDGEDARKSSGNTMKASSFFCWT